MTEPTASVADLHQRVDQIDQRVDHIGRRVEALEQRRPGWVSTTAAADMLGLRHRSTVIDWINAGRLQAWRLSEGQPWRVSIASIDALLAAQPTD